jgi:hypothetical protein
MPRLHGAWHASVRQVLVSTSHVNEASGKFLWRHRQEWGLTLHIKHVWFSVVSLPLPCLHDLRLVGSRLQIHECKYESVARFRIHAPWKRGWMELLSDANFLPSTVILYNSHTNILFSIMFPNIGIPHYMLFNFNAMN